MASWVARGFAGDDRQRDQSARAGVGAVGKPAWDVTRDDMDRVVGAWVAAGIAASTRRGYVQAFKGFHKFLVARKAPSIEAALGFAWRAPLDEFNAARHVGNESASAKAPPTAERMEEFFEFLRDRIATARKFGSAAGLHVVPHPVSHRRAAEVSAAPNSGLHLVAVRSASSTCVSARAQTSGPRPDGCPCWTGWT